MATEKSAKSKPGGKKSIPVMDVSKPGKTAANATSRPVIVGHKPLVQDPMVSHKTPEKTADPPADEQKPPKKVMVHEKVLAPLKASESTDPSEEEKASVPPTPEPEALEPKSAEPEPVDKPAPEESKEETPQPTDEATLDAVADQAISKKQASKETEEEKKRREELAKLVEDKKYFVPIGQVSHRRHARWTLALLLLLVLLAAAWYVLDAELVDTGIKLPFDLIKV